MKPWVHSSSRRQALRVARLAGGLALVAAAGASAQVRGHAMLMQRRAFTNVVESVSRPKREPVRRAHAEKPPVQMPFYILNYRLLPAVDHFAASGFMGDVSDVRLSGAYEGTRDKGYPCLKIKYAGLGEAGWAGVMWQNPANNWGTVDGGYNLTRAKRLGFWARGEKGGEMVEIVIGGASSVFPDSDGLTTGDIRLTSEWKQYLLDLSSADLSYISCGFGFILKQPNHLSGCTIYLDDVRYE